MKLGILQCDPLRKELVERHGEYANMFIAILSSVYPEMSYKVFATYNGVLPQLMDEADAYLITGSRYGVNDDYFWIRQLEAFVCEATQAKKKLIGICFGHQIICKALGGTVERSSKGWGIGMSHNRVLNQKPWMCHYQDRLNILVSHQDQVVDVPNMAEILACSDFCPNYMLQIGTHILTIQGHPEFTKAYLKDLIESREDILDKHKYNQAINSLNTPEDNTLFARWMVDFLMYDRPNNN